MRASFIDLMQELPVRIQNQITNKPYLHGLLDGAYGAPWRQYHTYSHLIEMIDNAYDNPGAAKFLHNITVEEELALWMAVIFHDFVYDLNTVPLKNEQLSAEIAMAYGPSVVYNRFFNWGPVGELIIATTHDDHNIKDPLGKFIADLDLSSMATDYTTFATHSALIIKEFETVHPLEMCIEGRRRFLADWMDRPKLLYYDFWSEEQMRNNMVKDYNRLAGFVSA